MSVTIIIRSRNDADIIERALRGVLEQSLQDIEVINFDNASTDGTLDKIKQFHAKIIPVPEGTYVPGRVLNKAAELSVSEIIVFLNSDCVPVNQYWLENLVKPFDDPAVGAVFSRQVAPKDSLPIIKIDTEAGFVDGAPEELTKGGRLIAKSPFDYIAMYLDFRFPNGYVRR